MFKKQSKTSYGADKIVRRTLADGTVKEYRYKRRLVGPPTTKRKPGSDPGSVNAMIEAYRRSPEWDQLAPQTRAVYSVYLRDLYKAGASQAAEVKRKHIIAIRNGIAKKRGHGAATGFLRAAGAAFSWAVENDVLDASPVHRVRATRKGTLPPWTEQVYREALDGLEEPYRRVVVLAAHTAQRRGDLVKMLWSDYDGEAIRVRQQKDRRTNKPTLVIPVHPELRAEIEAWRAGPRSAVTILTNPSGKPWTAAHLTRELSRRVKSLGFGRFTLHGLRKLAASRLAEAGCSTREIAAIGGWRSLSMVQHYSDAADQETLARGAVVRLESARKR